MEERIDTPVWQRARASADPWLYPFNGILYFTKHRFLWPLLRARLIPLFLVSLLVFAILLFWTYLPQVAFLAIFHGHGAWVNAACLVLGEGTVVTSLLFEAFMVDETQVDVFDSVLVNEGHEGLVSVARPVAEEAENSYKRLGKPLYSSVYSPFSLRQIVEFILLLPLNLVPWIGVPLFLWLTGYRAGPLQHFRYFKLREFTKREKKAFVKSRRLQYTSFGGTALFLQLIPGLSMLFLLTTAAGSALWVSKMENETRSHPPEASDDPPPYTEFEDEPA